MLIAKFADNSDLEVCIASSEYNNIICPTR